MSKRVLITGGAGFVGGNLAEYLHTLGHKVTIADNLVRRGSEQSLPLFKRLGIEFIHCDIRNKEDLKNLSGANVVLHCAAQPSAVNYYNPEFDFTNNTTGLVNVLEYCRERYASLIFWSTNKCYSGDLVNLVPHEIKGNRFVWSEPAYKMTGWSNAGFNEKLSLDGKDHSIYGASKVSADLLVQEWSDAFKIPAICNRFSCLAGPKQWGKAEQGWVTWFAIANELELPIDIFGFEGYQVRDCLFTPDINSLIAKQIEAPPKYAEVYNVGGGVNNTISISEAIQYLEKVNKPWIQIKNHPQRRADQKIYISDNTKVSNDFNWTPKVSIEKGYDQIIEWVKENKNLLKQLYSK